VAYDEIDVLTGLQKVDLAPVRVFTFTHEKLKPHFKNRPFLTCDGFLSQLGSDKYFLNLQFDLETSDKLFQNYKGISATSVLRITLINGDQLFLSNLLDDPGTQLKEGRVSFNTFYPLTKQDIKLLKKYEIAYMGVIWKGGYETYSVHELDFVRQQLECLSYLK
jgi:hypothetical protein